MGDVRAYRRHIGILLCIKSRTALRGGRKSSWRAAMESGTEEQFPYESFGFVGSSDKG